jgi:hypothetical protein
MKMPTGTLSEKVVAMAANLVSGMELPRGSEGNAPAVSKK